MNPDTLFQTVQKGLRVTVGATTDLVESIQDATRREQTFNRLRTNPTQLIDEWATKGESTEREARTFVDGLLNQSPFNPNSAGTTTVNTTATPIAPDVQQDLRDLTAQIAELRAELERLRQQD
jgi:polyhydroxyalkanoate synthesis regulator phasin